MTTSGEVKGFLILGLISPLPMLYVAKRIDRLSHILAAAQLGEPSEPDFFEGFADAVLS